MSEHQQCIVQYYHADGLDRQKSTLCFPRSRSLGGPLSTIATVTVGHASTLSSQPHSTPLKPNQLTLRAKIHISQPLVLSPRLPRHYPRIPTKQGMFTGMKTNLESQVASNVGTFDRQENIVRAVETIRDVLRSYTLPPFLSVQYLRVAN
jgi:hypothetical protein